MFNIKTLKSGKVSDEAGFIGKLSETIGNLFSFIGEAKLGDTMVYGIALLLMGFGFYSANSGASLTTGVMLIVLILSAILSATFFFGINKGAGDDTSSYSAKFLNVAKSISGDNGSGTLVVKSLILLMFVGTIAFGWYTSNQIGNLVGNVANGISASSLISGSDTATTGSFISNAKLAAGFVVDVASTILFYVVYLALVGWVIGFSLKGIDEVKSESGAIMNGVFATALLLGSFMFYPLFFQGYMQNSLLQTDTKITVGGELKLGD